MAKREPKSRTVVCAVTGEKGSSLDFVHIGTKYYKSQEVYDEMRREVDTWAAIKDFLAYDICDYGETQKFPSYLTKVLKDLRFYNYKIVAEVIRKNSSYLCEIAHTKEFSSERGKLMYIFAIINNEANELYQKEKRKKRLEKITEDPHVDLMVETLNEAPKAPIKQKNRDISRYIEEGDD